MTDVIDDTEQINITVGYPFEDFSLYEIENPGGYLSITPDNYGYPNRRINFLDWPRNSQDHYIRAPINLSYDFQILFHVKTSMLEERHCEDAAGAFFELMFSREPIGNYQAIGDNGMAIYLRRFSGNCYPTEPLCTAAGCTWNGTHCICDEAHCGCTEWYPAGEDNCPINSCISGYYNILRIKADGISGTQYEWNAMQLNTDYWVRCTRYFTTKIARLEVFTDETLTQRIAQILLTGLTNNNPYTYFIAVAGRGVSGNQGEDQLASGFIDDISITPATITPF